jgi:alpha-L-fucosidase
MQSLPIPSLSPLLIGLALFTGGTSLAVEEEAAANKKAPLDLPYTKGPFKPSWESLAKYQTPTWFRDAKFGIWAHWGPQCQAEAGDWYARNMYIQGHPQYEIHQKLFGHPSEFGFKDVIHQWKAEKFDADALVQLYAKSGAKYFVAMAVHHDNFDLWDSRFQPWNAVNMGPKQDLIGKWASAAKTAGLHFGVSIHARSAWSWYEVTRMSDTSGPKAGIPYDGNLTKADGKGTWWEGYDPQDLYAQYGHRMSPHPESRKLQQKEPGDPPSLAFCTKYYNRVQDLIGRYQPDLVYFDDYKLPLYGINQSYGLSIAAGLYNANMARNGGRNDAVMNTKTLNDTECQSLVKDLEVGVERDIKPIPWQVDACIGHWHYLKDGTYRSPGQVVRALADVVSKNGNLLLNIPVRGEGTIDEAEQKVLASIGAWMSVNGEAIYDTRPWRVYGEGPSTTDNPPEIAKGGIALFRKGSYTAEDIRFTAKPGILYAIALAWPTTPTLTIRALATAAGTTTSIREVRLLGHPEPLNFSQTSDGLVITLPTTKPGDHAYAFRITDPSITVSLP